MDEHTLESTRARMQAVQERVVEIDQIRLGFDYLFELSYDLMCITNPEGYFIRLNAAWLQLGWTIEELMSKPYIEFIHPDDRHKTGEKAASMAIRDLEFDFSNRFLGKDGTVFHFAWRTVASPTQTGYLFAVARIVDKD